MQGDVRQGRGRRPTGEPTELVTFEGADAAAAEALLRAFFVLAKALPAEADAALPLGWCGRMDERTVALARLLEPLAGGLVWRATGRRAGGESRGKSTGLAARLLGRGTRSAAPPSDEELAAEARAVDERALALAAELRVRSPQTIRVSEGLLGCDLAGELVREQGLEAGLDLYLVGHRDGSPGIAWAPMPPHRALVWSMGRLFDRVECMLRGEWILTAERHAARWHFSRWSGTGGDEVEFARGVREQEFALVDRPLVALGATALEAFSDGRWFDEVPQLQRQLAGALNRSFVGVFRVRERRGDEVVFEAGGSRRTYDVLEHSPDTEYDAGFVGLGRLIPFEGHYLRSPGMALLKSDDPGLVHDLAQSMSVAAAEVSPPILIEGVIGTLVDRVKVPRRVPPAPSRTAAREMFQEVTAALDELGLGVEATDERVPEELRDRATGDYREYRLDQTLAEWLSALGEYSRVPGRGRRRKQKRPKKRRR